METGSEVNELKLAREVPDFSPREPVPPPPPPKGFFERLEIPVKKTASWATGIAGLALVAMLIISVGDVIGLKFIPFLGSLFGLGWAPHPLPGAPEFIAFIAVLVISFSMGFSLIERAHIQVDVFVNKFPSRLKTATGMFVSFLSLCFFILLAWQTFLYGNNLRLSNEVSMTQHIPYYPFVYALALACLPVCFYLFLEGLRGLTGMVRR